MLRGSDRGKKRRECPKRKWLEEVNRDVKTVRVWKDTESNRKTCNQIIYVVVFETITFPFC